MSPRGLPCFYAQGETSNDVRVIRQKRVKLSCAEVLDVGNGFQAHSLTLGQRDGRGKGGGGYKTGRGQLKFYPYKMRMEVGGGGC